MKNLENQNDSSNESTSEYLSKGKKTPNFIISMTPPIFLLVTLNIFKLDVIYSLMLAVILCLIVFWPFIDKKIQTINVGATNTVLPIVNTSADVGYGAVIAGTAGFAIITGLLADIPGSPLISLYLATTFLAGITGSSSGGLGIAMETLSSTYINLGLNPEVMHRVATIASGGFDALPHNGGVITFLVVTGLTHKEAYKHIFVTGIIGPVFAAIPALIVAILFY
jgi:H+/gluconate symporter-like permease